MGDAFGVIVLVVFAVSFIGACASEGRSPKRLPEGTKPPDGNAPKALPRVPTREERMKSVGIATATAYEDMYSWGVHVPSVRMEGGGPWCPFRESGPLGKLFVVSVETLGAHGVEIPAGGPCHRCDAVMGMALYETVKRAVPPGTLDEGRTEPRALGRYCGRCGDFSTRRAEDSQVLGSLWGESRNLNDVVVALESDEAKVMLDEARLTRVESELDDVESRRDRLIHERFTLQENLGRLKGAPGRDRFAEDPRTAALEDAPVDSTRSLPVIRDSRD